MQRQNTGMRDAKRRILTTPNRGIAGRRMSCHELLMSPTGDGTERRRQPQYVFVRF
jgi:hypothetical protein